MVLVRGHKDSASRTQWQEKHDFFLPIVEAQPIFSEAKAVQAEHNEGVS